MSVRKLAKDFETTQWTIQAAGLLTEDVMRVLPAAGRRLHQDRFPNLRVVHAWISSFRSTRGVEADSPGVTDRL